MNAKVYKAIPFKKTWLNLSSIILLLLFGVISNTALSETQQSIRFGVLSIAPPARIFTKWQPFVDYMSEQLGRPVEIVVPRGFGKMKDTIARGEVDFFYINSRVFFKLKNEGKAFGIAQMQNIEGKTTSRSELFVRKDSGINTVADLKGKRIAFVSPMGAGGYMAPRASLYDQNLRSGKETEEVFTKNLSNSIHGVLLGDYDAASMCGVNFDLMKTKIETGELKVIDISNDYPENIIGGRPGLSSSLVENFQTVLLDMPALPAGRDLLGKMYSMKIKSFVAYDPAIEEITRSLLNRGNL